MNVAKGAPHQFPEGSTQ